MAAHANRTTNDSTISAFLFWQFLREWTIRSIEALRVCLTLIWNQLKAWGMKIVEGISVLRGLFFLKPSTPPERSVPPKPSNAFKSHKPFHVRQREMDNHGGGDCLFYAISLKLIEIIQYEAASVNPQLNRQLAERWLRLDPNLTYQDLCRFTHRELASSKYGSRVHAHWHVLQQSLRQVLIKHRVEQMHQTVMMENGTLQHKALEKTRFYEYLHDRYRSLVSNKGLQPSDYNPFRGVNLTWIDPLFRKIHALNLSYDETRYRLREEILAIWRDPSKQQRLISIMTTHIRQAWGTDDDLRELGEILDVNISIHSMMSDDNYSGAFDTQEEDVRNVFGRSKPERHTVTVKNKYDVHWVSVVEEVEEEDKNGDQSFAFDKTKASENTDEFDETDESEIDESETDESETDEFEEEPDEGNFFAPRF